MSVFSFGDSPPHTPDYYDPPSDYDDSPSDYDDSPSEKEDNLDFDADYDDPLSEKEDNLDFDADYDDPPSEKDDNLDFDADYDDPPSEEGDNLDFDADYDDPPSENYDYFDGDDDNYNPFVNCRVCNKLVSSSFLNEHLDNQHKCNYCNDSNYMNAESLKTHIKENHMIPCKHCNAKKLTIEIAEHEQSHPAVGMIQLNRLTNERFNQLVAENRIYAIEGSVFIKEPECLTLSEQLSKVELD